MDKTINKKFGKMSWEIWSPEKAKAALSKNTKNRPVKKTLVERKVKAFLSGEWFESTDCIGIDENGVIVNGQHRLLACIEAGVTFGAWTLRGLKPRTREVIDQGAKRTGGDAFSMKFSDTNPNWMAAYVKCMAVGPTAGGFVTNSELISWRRKLKPAVDLIEEIGPFRSRRGTFYACVWAAVGCASFSEDHDLLREFSQILIDGMIEGRPMDEADKCVVRWRDRLNRHREDRVGGKFKMTTDEIFSKTCRVLEAWLKGEAPKRFSTLSNFNWNPPGTKWWREAGASKRTRSS